MQKFRVCTLTFFSISKLQYRNSNSYFNLILLLSGDLSLNPGPLYNNNNNNNNNDNNNNNNNNQLQPQSEWSAFNSRELHFIYLNVNSLLPKFDELKNVAELSNALSQIDISESQFEDSVLSSEIHNDNYNTLRCDRNRHWGGLVCYIRNDLSYDVESLPRLKSKTFSWNYLYQIRNQ